MLRVKGGQDACRLKPMPCDGRVDSDALRLAVGRGSSAKLGHLRVHAKTCFRFLAQIPITLHRVSTTENEADIMTKVLSAVRHRELCRTDYDLDAVPEASAMTHAVLCRHAGWQCLGYARSSLLMFVRNSPAADQAGRCLSVKTGVCSRRVHRVFTSRSYKLRT